MTYSFWGSVAYMAPEVLKREGYDKSVDWYLLGVCLYEMLFGEPPFYNDDSTKMHDDILNAKLKIPDGISKNWKDLLKKLLEKNPKKRCGWGKKGPDEIKAHKFFKGIVWEEVYNKKLKLPVPDKREIKSKNYPPSEVFGDYIDFEVSSGMDGWSFCKTIIEHNGDIIY